MSVRLLNLPARPRLFRLLVAWLSLLAALLFSLGCDSPRNETLIWSGHPSLVLCHDQSTIRSHDLDDTEMIDGLYRHDEDCIYILGAGDTLTAYEALVFVHEIVHAADAKHHGNVGAVLRDESGDVNFDTHGWANDTKREHHP